MKKRKSRLIWVIWALIIALVAVAGLMAFKQWEYTQSADYYHSLRGQNRLMHWLIPSACAEETIVQDAEALRFLVESLFAAATGTTEADELAARKDMDEPAQLARSAANAAYRAQVLPWLKACFQPDGWADAAKEPAELDAQSAYEAMQQNPLGRQYLQLLEPFGGTDFATCFDVSRRICRQWVGEIDPVRLREINRHYEMWLYAPGTPIDYPVVQCSNNDRYLSKLFDGRRNSSGTLFIDYRNLDDLGDPNTLIYGHHMRNKSMFGTLVFYKEQAYYESHPYMLVMDEDQIWLVELFSGYTTTSTDHCYDIALSDDRDLQRFVAEAQRKSNFVSPVQVTAGDRLLTLSTCAYSFENARYIAIGRLTPWWQKTDGAMP